MLALWVVAATVASSVAAVPAASSFAYVTFYYGGDSSAASLLSTRVLLSSLRRTGTEYPIVVVVPPSVPSIVHDVLTTEGALVTTISGVVAPDLSTSLTAQALTHFRNKLLLWSLTEYRRLVLLDHDDLGGWLPRFRWLLTPLRVRAFEAEGAPPHSVVVVLRRFDVVGSACCVPVCLWR